MAKTVALIAFALCIFAIAGNVQSMNMSDPKFNPDPDSNYWIGGAGPVRCVTCRLNATSLVEDLRTGELEIKCRSRKNGAVTVTQAAFVNKDGSWMTSINLPYNANDDVCVVRLVKSMDPRCTVKVPGLRSLRPANLNDWEFDGNRRALFVEGLLGFMNKEHLPDCRKVRNKKGKLIPAITEPVW